MILYSPLFFEETMYLNCIVHIHLAFKDYVQWLDQKAVEALGLIFWYLWSHVLNDPVKADIPKPVCIYSNIVRNA